MTGSTARSTVTVVVEVETAPQASVTVRVIVLTPATGVKQTVSPESVPFETVTEAMFPSASLVVNPGRQMVDKSQTKMLELAGDVATGTALNVTVTLTVQVSERPSESVTIAVILYRPAVSAWKQIESPETEPRLTVSDSILPSASVAVRGEIHT